MMNELQKEQAAPVSTYAISKRWVWFLVVMALIWFLYKANDWATHLNWPPVDRSNDAYIKSLGCDKGQSYLVTKQMLDGDTSSNVFTPVGIDREKFVQRPDCASAGLYLGAEGSGVRDEFDVYDMTKKTKTAHIVITHEKFEHQ